MTIDLMQNEMDHEMIEEGARVFVAENFEGDVMSGAFIGIASEDFTNDSDRIVEIVNGQGEAVAVYAFTVGKIT